MVFKGMKPSEKQVGIFMFIFFAYLTLITIGLRPNASHNVTNKILCTDVYL